MDMKKLSRYLDITLSMLGSDPEISDLTSNSQKTWKKGIWYWPAISANRNLTIKILDTYIDKNWNWFELSCNRSLSKLSLVLCRTFI